MSDSRQILKPASWHEDARGVPHSPEYGDFYHGEAGALPQARHVFLGGNGLPGRWRGRAAFTIAETGFGLGHNFLAAWRAWLDDPARSHRLHYLAFEAHPFAVEDLLRAWNRLPDDHLGLAREVVAVLRHERLLGGVHPHAQHDHAGPAHGRVHQRVVALRHHGQVDAGVAEGVVQPGVGAGNQHQLADVVVVRAHPALAHARSQRAGHHGALGVSRHVHFLRAGHGLHAVHVRMEIVPPANVRPDVGAAGIEDMRPVAMDHHAGAGIPFGMAVPRDVVPLVVDGDLVFSGLGELPGEHRPGETRPRDSDLLLHFSSVASVKSAK